MTQMTQIQRPTQDTRYSRGKAPKKVVDQSINNIVPQMGKGEDQNSEIDLIQTYDRDSSDNQTSDMGLFSIGLSGGPTANSSATKP